MALRVLERILQQNELKTGTLRVRERALRAASFKQKKTDVTTLMEPSRPSEYH
jgi:hypothetical protein